MKNYKIGFRDKSYNKLIFIVIISIILIISDLVINEAFAKTPVVTKITMSNNKVSLWKGRKYTLSIKKDNF